MSGPLRVLGDSPEQIAAFHRYLAAFGAGDLNVFPDYYTDDIHFDLTLAPPFIGKVAVIAFYRRTFGLIREDITIERFSATADDIAVLIHIVFTAMKDAPDFPVGPMLAGDSVSGRFTVDYHLRDGLICALKVLPVN